jgi:hypothetical protein
MMAVVASALWAQSSGLTISYKDGSVTKEETFNLDSVSSYGYSPSNKTVFVQPFIGVQLSIPYQNLITFSFPPIVVDGVNKYGIDVEATELYGGLTLDWYNNKHAVFVYDKGIKVYHFTDKTWQKWSWNDIKPNWKELSEGNSFRLYYGYTTKVLEIIYYNAKWQMWMCVPIVGEKELYGIDPSFFNTPLLSFTLIVNSGEVAITDGIVTVIAKEW